MDLITLVALILSVLLLVYLTVTLLYPGEILTCPPMAGCNLLIYSLVLLLTVRPVGIYLARVLEGSAPGSIPCSAPSSGSSTSSAA